MDFHAVIDDLHRGVQIYQLNKSIGSLQQVPILFWKVWDSVFTYPEAQQLGAAGCVMMPAITLEGLVKARDVILAGSTYYPPLE